MKITVSRETFTSYYKNLVLTVLAMFSFFCCETGASQPIEKPFVLAISQIVEHPALDDVRKGFMDRLGEKGFVVGTNLVVEYRNAQGNIATSSQIAVTLMANNPLPDVFVAIGTPTAQSAIAAGRKHKIPVVFAAVTDPVASKLVSDLIDHRPLVTGVIDFPPIQEQLKLMKTFYPDLTKIGVIYNAGESNSVSVIKKFKKMAQDAGIEIVDGIVSKSSDISLAFRRLHAKGVQVIYVPQDNTVISAASSLAQLSIAMNIPVFTSDSGSVSQGAFASLSYGYYDVGVKTADYAIRLYNGEDAVDMPITTPENTALYINTDTAKKLNIVIPEEMLANAVLYPEQKES